jgi:hypothetical protein
MLRNGTMHQTIIRLLQNDLPWREIPVRWRRKMAAWLILKEYTDVIEGKDRYEMADGRKVNVLFIRSEMFVVESFEPENENSIELQQQGWQMIMNNFKRYAESKR